MTNIDSCQQNNVWKEWGTYDVMIPLPSPSDSKSNVSSLLSGFVTCNYLQC